MRPDGETAHTLGREIAPRIAGWRESGLRAMRSASGDGNGAGEAPKPERPDPEEGDPEKPGPEKPSPERPTPEKPKPDDDKKPYAEKCAALREVLIAAEADERAMRGYSLESEKSFEDKRDEVNRLWEEFQRTLKGLAVEYVGAV